MLWFLSNLLLTVCGAYAAPLRVEIRKSSEYQTPIAVWHVNHQEVQNIVAQDLDRSGAFLVLKSGCFWEGVPCFVVRANIVRLENGLWQAQVCLDKDDQEEERIVIQPICAKNIRDLSHQIANKIHEKIVGQPGHFSQCIIYRSQCGAKESGGRSRVSICDSDGARGMFLTPQDLDIRTLCADARSGRIAYAGYKGGHTRLFVAHPKYNKIYEIVLKGGGIPIAPRFSPCGKKLIFSLAKDGVTSLYQYTFDDQKVCQYTKKGLYIDVSASYAPDGQSFVFVSDRSKGRPRLYVKHSGQAPVLLSKGAGSYFAPCWSPDGQWIIFVKRRSDGYYLGIMASDGTQERLIARDHMIDSPSWSDNSRIILFTAQQKRFGPFSLFTIDRAGRTLRKISLNINGKQSAGDNPCWGTELHQKS